MNGPDRFSAADVEVRETKPLYSGFFSMMLYRLRHRLFRGGWSGEMTREVFLRTPAVAVLLYDPDRDAVVLVEQFRVGALAAGREPWMIEVVAGIVEPGESPEQVARREALEEAGCTVREIVPIADFQPSPGGCSEVITLLCGRVDARGIGGIHGLPDEHEDIRVTVVPADEAIAGLDAGLYKNGIALVALGWLARNRADLRQRWSASPCR